MSCFCEIYMHLIYTFLIPNHRSSVQRERQMEASRWFVSMTSINVPDPRAWRAVCSRLTPRCVQQEVWDAGHHCVLFVLIRPPWRKPLTVPAHIRQLTCWRDPWPCGQMTRPSEGTRQPLFVSKIPSHAQRLFLNGKLKKRSCPSSHWSLRKL